MVIYCAVRVQWSIGAPFMPKVNNEITGDIMTVSCKLINQTIWVS